VNNQSNNKVACDLQANRLHFVLGYDKLAQLGFEAERNPEA
jgi:hypothetical protein